MIDDLQLHSVKELARLLNEQWEFSLLMHQDKVALFRKMTDARELQDWGGQPYIVKRSDEYDRSGAPYAI